MTGMALSLGCSVELRQELAPRQLLLYDTAGEVELFSLHRIRSRIRGLDVHFAVRGKLVHELLARNAEYQRIYGNQKLCVTAGDVDSSVYGTVKAIEERNKSDLSQVVDMTIRAKIKDVFEDRRAVQQQKMRQWFADNYDRLLYDTSSRIPFPVVLAMRRRFFKWANQQDFDFNEPIQELIEEAASSVGLDTREYTDYKDVWEALKRYRGRN
jgi:hypothetical protein